MLSRPIFTASVCAFIMMLAAVYFSSSITVPIICALALLSVICLIFCQRMTACKSLAGILLTGAIAAGYTLFVLMHSVAPVAALDGKSGHATMRVTGDVQAHEDSVVVPVVFTGVGILGAPDEFNGYLYTDHGLMLQVGDRLTGEVAFVSVPDYREDKYYSEGKYIAAYLSEVDTVSRWDGGFSVPVMLARIRRFVTDFFATNLNPTEAAFLSGLTMNDKSEFTDEMYGDFSRSGISHIVAVSGMHLSILCAAISKLLDKLRLPRRMAAVILIPIILLMILLVGAPYSAIRSGIMVIITLLGTLFFKKSDALTSLGVAALTILAFQPLTAVSLSFQLSFAATLGLIVLARPIDGFIRSHPCPVGWIRWIIERISSVFAVSVSAALFTLPVLAIRFEYVPLVAPLTNICLLVSVSVTLITALLAAFFAPISFLSKPLLFVSGMLSKYILSVAKLFGGLPFATLSFASQIMKLALAAAILLLAVAVLQNPKRRTVVLSLTLGAVILLTSALCDQIHRQNVVSVRIFPSKAGIAATVTKGYESVLIGTGDGYCLFDAETYLQTLGIRSFDLVLLPDLDATFAMGWKNLIHSTEYDIITAQGDGEYRDEFEAVRDGVELGEVAELRPISDVSIRMIRTEDGNGALVNAYGTTLLIAKENFENAPADVLVCTLPNTDTMQDDQSVVLCGETTKATFYAEKIQNKTAVYVVGDRALELEIKKTGSYTLRRMS